MKKIYSLLIFILLITNISFSQWVEQNSGVTTQLTSVSAIDYFNAWICGYSGVVLKTANSGTNWQNVSGNGIPSTIQLINVFGISTNIALVAGYIGSNTWVYRTTNGGANWTQVFTETGGFIDAVWVDAANSIGFMAGDPVGGRWSLWKTTNAGATWDSSGRYLPQASTESGYNNAMQVAGSRIWICTNNTRIYYSSNNGANWSIQTTSPEVSTYAIWFDYTGNPLGYTGGAGLLRSTNFGSNWTPAATIGAGNYAGMAGTPFFSGMLYYVKSGNNNIYWTNGTGNSFIVHTAPAGTYRHITTGRYTGGPYVLYAVRNNGGISRTMIFTEGIKKISDIAPINYTLYQNYPNPFNPNTKIRFEVAKTALSLRGDNVRLAVYDILGREVQTIVNEQLKPGTYEVEWNASNYPSGVYYYKLTIGEFSETRKAALIK